MVTRRRLQDALNDILRPPEAMTDASNNGLQVEGTADIERIAFGVDASVELFDAAAAWQAHALIVHHGLSWGPGFATLVGVDARRVGLLLATQINLFAYHLPLDCHPTLGNNAQIAQRLDLDDVTSFGRYGGIDIGVCGELPESIHLTDLADRVATRLATRTTVVCATDNPTIRRLAVVSGGGADLVTECSDAGIDCLLTGEIAHQHIHPTRESGVAVIAAGHYATEVWGLKALMQSLETSLPVTCRFIDLPTGY